MTTGVESDRVRFVRLKLEYECRHGRKRKYPRHRVGHVPQHLPRRRATTTIYNNCDIHQDIDSAQQCPSTGYRAWTGARCASRCLCDR